MKADMNFDKMLHVVDVGLDGLRWQECKDYGAPDDSYEWYYAEERLYVIRNKKMKAYYFVGAKSPTEAFEKLRKRFLNQNRNG